MSEQLKERVRAFLKRNDEAENALSLDPARIERFVKALEAREHFIDIAESEKAHRIVYFHQAIECRGVEDLERALHDGIWAILQDWVKQ